MLREFGRLLFFSFKERRPLSCEIEVGRTERMCKASQTGRGGGRYLNGGGVSAACD